MKADSATAPEVRPAGELLWSPKDRRWLAGGRWLHGVLAILLLLLLAVPVQIVEESRPIIDTGGFFDDEDTGETEAPGVYWRWSAPSDSGLRSDAELDARKAMSATERWTAALAPVLAGVLALISLFQPAPRRAVLLIVAGMPLVLQIWHWGMGSEAIIFEPWVEEYHFSVFVQAIGVSLEGEPHLYWLYWWWPLALVVLLIGIHRGVMRGGRGPIARFICLGAGVPLGVALAFFLLQVTVGGNVWSLISEVVGSEEAEQFRAGEWTAVDTCIET